MLKMMICLNKPDDVGQEQFASSIEKLLLNYMGEFSQISYTVIDEYITPAKPYEIINSSHPKDAVITVWRDNMLGLEDFYRALIGITAVFQSYAVLESQPITHQSAVGRVSGMCQLAFLQQPKRLSREQWLDFWIGQHTQVGIETQSNFSYRQNIITLAGLMSGLMGQSTGEWPLMDAIVEENFPEAAMTNRALFFAAEDDETRYKANEQRMIESCMNFIDFDRFDCVPMSEYIIKI